MTRRVPQCALDFIRQAEGCKLTTYRDSGGIWTIGVGHTGPEVHEGLTISQDQADAYLFADATKAATRLALRVKDELIQGLTDHQYGALVSFVFNVGAGPTWTIWKVLNVGNLDAVPGELTKFDKAHINGKLVVVNGLHNRRAAEIAFWRTADVAAAATIAQAVPVEVSSAVTRTVETPQTENVGKPLAKSKSFLASLFAAPIAFAADQAQTVQHWADSARAQLAPYVGGSEVLAHFSSNLTLVAGVLAIGVPILIALKNHEAKQL